MHFIAGREPLVNQHLLKGFHLKVFETNKMRLDHILAMYIVANTIKVILKIQITKYFIILNKNHDTKRDALVLNKF